MLQKRHRSPSVGSRRQIVAAGVRTGCVGRRFGSIASTFCCWLCGSWLGSCFGFGVLRFSVRDGSVSDAAGVVAVDADLRSFLVCYDYDVALQCYMQCPLRFFDATIVWLKYSRTKKLLLKLWIKAAR